MTNLFYGTQLSNLITQNPNKKLWIKIFKQIIKYFHTHSEIIKNLSLSFLKSSKYISNASGAFLFIDPLQPHFFFFSLDVYRKLNEKFDNCVLFERFKCQLSMCTLEGSYNKTVLKILISVRNT